MTIPQTIISELASLQAQVAAAEPLQRAPRATIKALQLNAETLVDDIEAAQTTLIGKLDSWDAPTDPEVIIQQIVGVFFNAVDQANITNLRGIAGRVLSNLNQLGPTPRATLKPPFVTPIPPWPVILIPAAYDFTLTTADALSQLPINVPEGDLALTTTAPLSSIKVVPTAALTLTPTTPSKGAPKQPAAASIATAGVAPTIPIIIPETVVPAASINAAATVPFTAFESYNLRPSAQGLVLTGPVPTERHKND